MSSCRLTLPLLRTAGHAAIEFAQSACPNVKEYLPGYNDAEYLVDLVTEADLAGQADKMADHYAGWVNTRVP